MMRLQSLAVTLVLLASIAGRANAEIPKIIFDTDITGDVDDVLALAMCHTLEANVINGIGFMQTVADQWPDSVPVIWSGFEIGESLPFPRQSIAQDLNYLPHHIVKESYLLHSGPEHDRPCWDQSSVLFAVFPDRGYFGLSNPGRVTVANDGFTRFIPPNKDTNGSPRDRFLTMSPTQQARVLESIVQLTVQPPRN